MGQLIRIREMEQRLTISLEAVRQMEEALDRYQAAQADITILATYLNSDEWRTASGTSSTTTPASPGKCRPSPTNCYKPANNPFCHQCPLSNETPSPPSPVASHCNPSGQRPGAACRKPSSHPHRLRLLRHPLRHRRQRRRRPDARLAGGSRLHARHRGRIRQQQPHFRPPHRTGHPAHHRPTATPHPRKQLPLAPFPGPQPAGVHRSPPSGLARTPHHPPPRPPTNGT